MRVGDERSDPMEDERGGVEERKTDETEQGGEGGKQIGEGDESSG